MIVIATFFSHFGAVRFKRRCEGLGWKARMMPVPRDLSSSCGTCVRYEGEILEEIPEEVEQIVEMTPQGYVVHYKA